MPRNDQVTRQWHLLRRLEGSRGETLQELVDSLPDDFPKNSRTIRRDLEALEAVGFPLVTDQVNGQTRWKLMEGFRDIPALGFSATELMALVFSRNLLRPLEGTEIQASLASALNKAASALPPQGHEYVRGMEKVFSVGLGPHKSYRQHQKTIDLVTQAIERARTAQIRYYSASRNTTTRREVDPYRLWYAAGGLYLIAYCHLRKDVKDVRRRTHPVHFLNGPPLPVPFGVQRRRVCPGCPYGHARKTDRSRAFVFKDRGSLG